MKAIIHVNTYDFVEYRENQYILFEDHILSTGPMEEYDAIREQYEPHEVTDGKGGLLLPALVLAHTHIYSTFARGMSLPFNPQNFLQVLEQLWWKMDGALDKEMVYHSGLMSAMGYIKHGVGTVIDHHASGRDIIGTLEELKRGVVDDFGLRGMFCFETSDRFDVDRCIRENREFAKDGVAGRFTGLFGMHAAMTLSDGTLKKIKIALGDTPIHVHVAESEMDQQDSQSKYGTSVIKRLDSFGLLNPDSLIVHGIYLDDEELKIIKERGCYMVLNPTSNMNNGVGLSDYHRIKAHHIPCMIGNDGMSTAVANEWQALLFAMHHRYSDPTAFGLDDLHRMILNSYDYANRRLNTKLGRLEVGYQADMLLLDEKAITPMDSSNVLGHLFYGYAMSFRPSHFWSRGVPKMAQYKILGEHEYIVERSVELAGKLWKEIG